MSGFNAVLAHQGGWDEMLLVAAPIVVFVLLLRFANQRAAKFGGATPEPTESAASAEHDSTVTPANQPGAGFDDDAPADD